MMGFRVLLAKELREQLRTNRFIAVVAVFVLFGIIGPLTDRYMKELIDAVGSQSGGFTIQVPPPSLNGVATQVLKNLSQFGIICGLLLAMGSVAWEKERGKNVLQIFWQAIVGAVTTILKNQSTDSLATRVPISGSYGTEKIGTWTAIASLLQNAFIRALVPKLDEHVTVRNVEEKLEGRQHEPDRRTTAGAAEKPKMWGSPFPEKGGPRLAQPPH